MTIEVAPRIAPEVAAALADARPVVALESTLLAHGLRRPGNRDVADALERAVRSHGAVPATIAVLDGVPHIGLTGGELDRVCAGGLAKLTRRDLGVAAGLRLDGATTVAATMTLAHAVGITVFGTGGLGGVHRGARENWDVSADLGVLATVAQLVVCSGVKSVLDVGATLEVLETLSVPVLGYRTEGFPGFYRRDSGYPVPWRVDSPQAVADVWRGHRARSPAGLVLANPVPPADELDAALHERLLAEGLAMVTQRHVTGKEVTPALLEHFHMASAGASERCNIALVTANVELAAQVAAELVSPR